MKKKKNITWCRTYERETIRGGTLELSHVKLRVICAHCGIVWVTSESNAGVNSRIPLILIIITRLPSWKDDNITELGSIEILLNALGNCVQSLWSHLNIQLKISRELVLFYVICTYFNQTDLIHYTTCCPSSVYYLVFSFFVSCLQFLIHYQTSWAFQVTEDGSAIYKHFSSSSCLWLIKVLYLRMQTVGERETQLMGQPHTPLLHCWVRPQAGMQPKRYIEKWYGYDCTAETFIMKTLYQPRPVFEQSCFKEPFQLFAWLLLVSRFQTLSRSDLISCYKQCFFAKEMIIDINGNWCDYILIEWQQTEQEWVSDHCWYN